MDRLKSIFHYGLVLLFVCSVVYKFEHNLIRPFAYLFELSLYILTHFSFSVFDLSEVFDKRSCLSVSVSLYIYIGTLNYLLYMLQLFFFPFPFTF